MLELLKLLVIVGGVLALASMILLAIPQCRLRDLLMPYIAWSFVVMCGLYCISPIDALPEIALGPLGIFDDLAAATAGIVTAVKTVRAAKQKHPNFQDPFFN